MHDVALIAFMEWEHFVVECVIFEFIVLKIFGSFHLLYISHVNSLTTKAKTTIVYPFCFFACHIHFTKTAKRYFQG